MKRRRFLKLAAVSTGALALGTGIANAQNNPQNSASSSLMARAATQFLASLGARRSQANLALDTEARTAWHWFPDNFYPNREGVTLKSMTSASREAALELLRVSTSERGFAKAQAIMATQRDLGRDPLDYHFTVYGDPASRAWAWALEGHHLSLNYTLSGDRVVVAPIFLGASPTYKSGARVAVMRREEEAMRELLRSLEPALRGRMVYDRATPGDTVTRNAVQVAPLPGVGIAVSELSAAQVALLLEVVTEYLSVLPTELGAQRLNAIQAVLPQARLGWAGALESRANHYYRLQGPGFLLEHDNSRDGGTHIHSVWREIGADFGRAVL